MTAKTTDAADLDANAEPKIIEIDENTGFKTVSFGSVLEMLRTRVLGGLPPHVRDEIMNKERGAQ